jgi:hypothetical protein
MADGEELAIEFYKPGSAQDLAQGLINFLTNPEKQQAMAVQNFSTALRMTMPTIVLKYLRHFELEQRTEALRQITRFRRLPGWVPSKSLMLRLMTRNSMGWVHRSAVHLPRASSTQKASLHNNVHDSRELSSAGLPLNRDAVFVGNGRNGGLGSGILTPDSGSATARGASHANGNHREQSEQLSPAFARHAADERKTTDPEWQQQSGGDWERIVPLRKVSAPTIHPVTGSGGNGNGGSGDSAAGSDAGGGEAAAEVLRKPTARK